MKFFVHALVVVCAVALPLTSALAAPPAYTCRRALEPIVADGVLNESTWTHAAAMSEAVIAGSTSPAPEPMSVQMAWDDDYLYLAARITDSDVYSTIATRDDTTWNQDNLEFFACLQNPQPGDGDVDYVEFEWSPRGCIWDGLFDGRMSAMSPYSPASEWDSAGLQLGTTILGTANDPSDIDLGFIVEAAVPWDDIYYHDAGGHPIDGTQIRLNVCRIGWDSPAAPVEGSNARGLSGSDVYYTWSPLTTEGAFFHQADQFGAVTFSTAPVPEPATAALLAAGAAALIRRRRR